MYFLCKKFAYKQTFPYLYSIQKTPLKSNQHFFNYEVQFNCRPYPIGQRQGDYPKN